MRTIYILLLFISYCFFSKASTLDSLLIVLDETISNRHSYNQQHEKNLSNIKELVNFANSDEQRYSLYSKLFEGYKQFNNDSSLFFVTKKQELAELLDNESYKTDARMNIAEIMMTAGMYKDALDILHNIDKEHLDTLLIDYYYHLCRKIYGLMADHSITKEEKTLYTHLTNTYRDTLLMVYPAESTTYKLVKADKNIVEGRNQEALNDLLLFLEQTEPNSHQYALLSYSVADAYESTGNDQQAKLHYAISAIADLRSGIREYVSLYRLAQILFKEGDINRAYNYIKCSLDDANECNARIRTIEISQVFPIFDAAYQEKIQNQKALMHRFLIAVSLLSLFLIIAIFLVYRQMKKVGAARLEVIDTNERLKTLNLELQDSNWQLKEINQTLSETNLIKEEYIARYMDQCSEYLEKMDSYRKSLNKLAAAGKLDELYKKLKSEQQIEDEIQGFYAGFDEAFLRLFPNFVKEFNALLTEKIEPKHDERLNTELRIFALIRLGITDSNKIAQFLRYSLQTIYNYRVRIRNKAKGDRKDFESQVMRIGRII